MKRQKENSYERITRSKMVKQNTKTKKVHWLGTLLFEISVKKIYIHYNRITSWQGFHLFSYFAGISGILCIIQLHPGPPGLTLGNLLFFLMDGKFPGAVALKLSNAYESNGQMPRPGDLKRYIYHIKNYSKCCGISTCFIIVVLSKKWSMFWGQSHVFWNSKPAIIVLTIKEPSSTKHWQHCDLMWNMLNYTCLFIVLDFKFANLCIIFQKPAF